MGNPACAFPPIRRFEFATHKYGQELLVDAGSTEELPGFEFHRTAHQLMFYDVLLLRRGRGRLLQEDRWHPVQPGAVVFHRPGELRRWQLEREAEGLVLFFTDEFLRGFLRDATFVRRLPFFRDEGPRVVQLDPGRAGRLEQMIGELRREIGQDGWGRDLVLQAETYRTLVWLARHTYAACPRNEHRAVAASWFRRFEEAVEASFRADRRVSAIARACGVSSSHLRTLVREATGLSVRDFVRRRVVQEARRLLLQTDLTVHEVARACGFDDPSHFSRYFRRAVGHAPRRFRRIAGSS